MKRKQVRIEELKKIIKEWDILSKTNTTDNIHNLSTSQRQDWVEELIELTTDIED